MSTFISSTIKKFRGLSKKVKITGGIIVILILGYLLFHKGAPTYQFVTVTEGSITETVSVTGNTTPISSVSLGFGNSGIVDHIDSSVGKKVTTGQLLASLDTSDLNAQIKQAQANLALQRAQKQNTILNVDQVQAQQDTLVASAYRTLLSDHLQAVASDQTVPLAPPTISGSYDGPEGDYLIHMYPAIAASSEAFYISGLESGFNQEASISPVALGTHGLFIQFPSSSLSSYGNSVWTVSIPNTKSSTYTLNKNNYDAALSNRDKALADAQAQIDANTQGSTVSDAQIESAEAAVQSIQSKVADSEIIAPITGVITQFDAKVGQFASAGSTLVSIISGDSFEIDALVSETDVGKISVGNVVTMTLDAFPNETFSGSVFYIDPAQTTTEGVVGYKIKIAYDKTDPRMKSGLTVNLDIQTRHKDNVLILPQYAILQNDSGTFVQVLDGKTTKDIPVTLGLQDQNGNVEVTSGVTSGEQVLNIGLKQK